MNDPVLADVAGLKAVSHPLRVRMLAALRSDGPATASELARRFDTDTGSTSYHLRTLAKYGFVAPADDQRDRRERRWKATRASTDWDGAAMAETAQGREAVALISRQQVAALMRAMEGFEAAPDPAWARAAGLSDLTGPHHAGLARGDRRAARGARAERAAADADDPAVRPVHLFAGGFPT